MTEEPVPPCMKSPVPADHNPVIPLFLQHRIFYAILRKQVSEHDLAAVDIEDMAGDPG